ncbi:MAG: glyoxalase [Rhodobacteraceae bacterium]|nr:glyoxalase [Paracoccaceae bacterium]
MSTTPQTQGPIPGLRGIDHIGLTVPDLDQAAAFFTGVLGCTTVARFGPFRDDTGNFMADVLDVHPRAVIESIVLQRCGHGSNIELFAYTAPDQTTLHPRNSDIGAHHLAFYVDDIDAAAESLRARGIATHMGPIPISDGPVAGQSILYFKAPWGLQLELISYPGGMAYERGAATVLWSPRTPAA